MTEHDLVRRQRELFDAELPRSFVVRKHADYATSGDPDFSITGNGMTSWWEFKHAVPRIKGTEIQRIKAQRLELAGYCRYVVFQRNGPVAATHVVRPRDVGANGWFVPETLEDGTQATAAGEDNYAFVLDFVRRVHRVASRA